MNLGVRFCLLYSSRFLVCSFWLVLVLFIYGPSHIDQFTVVILNYEMFDRIIHILKVTKLKKRLIYML